MCVSSRYSLTCTFVGNRYLLMYTFIGNRYLSDRDSRCLSFYFPPLPVGSSVPTSPYPTDTPAAGGRCPAGDVPALFPPDTSSEMNHFFTVWEEGEKLRSFPSPAEPPEGGMRFPERVKGLPRPRGEGQGSGTGGGRCWKRNPGAGQGKELWHGGEEQSRTGREEGGGGEGGVRGGGKDLGVPRIEAMGEGKEW